LGLLAADLLNDQVDLSNKLHFWAEGQEDQP
jgi:hypothetical protein